MGFINIHAQSYPHDSAVIILTRDEAEKMQFAFLRIVNGASSSDVESMASDGEACTVIIQVVSNDKKDNLPLPYTDKDYQPAPIPNTTPGIHDELLSMRGLPESLRAMLRKRKAKGLQDYKVPLQRGNGRDAALDCAEEVADAIAYAQQMSNDILREALIAVWEDHFNG